MKLIGHQHLSSEVAEFEFHEMAGLTAEELGLPAEGGLKLLTPPSQLFINVG